jgi:hypothetical protein
MIEGAKLFVEFLQIVWCRLFHKSEHIYASDEFVRCKKCNR